MCNFRMPSQRSSRWVAWLLGVGQCGQFPAQVTQVFSDSLSTRLIWSLQLHRKSWERGDLVGWCWMTLDGRLLQSTFWRRSTPEILPFWAKRCQKNVLMILEIYGRLQNLDQWRLCQVSQHKDLKSLKVRDCSASSQEVAVLHGPSSRPHPLFLFLLCPDIFFLTRLCRFAPADCPIFSKHFSGALDRTW